MIKWIEQTMSVVGAVVLLMLAIGAVAEWFGYVVPWAGKLL